jgi:hypothetical protein
MRRPTLLAALLLAPLAACGATTSTPGVASLPPTAGTHSAGTAATGTETGSPSDGPRPVLRLDDTDQRRAALIDAYRSCLLQHGATKASGDDIAPAATGTIVGILLHQPVPKAAEAACVQLDPEQPPELDAATNPDFHAESLAYVACLQQHGEWVRLLDDHDLDWTYVDGHPVPADNATFEQTCLLQAFGGH